MMLYFHQKLRELQISAHEFFQLAYMAKFNKLMDLNDDYAQYLLHGILPKYAVEYLKQLQENERARDLVHQVRQERGDDGLRDSSFHLDPGDQEDVRTDAVLDVPRVQLQGGQA